MNTEMQTTLVDSDRPTTNRPETDWRVLAWAPRAVTVAVAFAMLFAMPTGAMLTLALLVATIAAAGIAELRRHGGQGVPALPYALED